MLILLGKSVNMKQETICPKCKSKNITKRGYFQTEAHRKQQRYFCKDCNKKFIEQTPFYRMRNNPNNYLHNRQLYCL